MSYKIVQGLQNYLNKGYQPWHMPGHKRRMPDEKKLDCLAQPSVMNASVDILEVLRLAYKMDVTEVPGTDDLHDPEDFIAESIEEISAFYGTSRSFYLVNGSTCGILAAIGATVKRGDKILVARNCHKSVYHAISLFDLVPCFVEPEEFNSPHAEGPVLVEAIEDAFAENGDIRAVVLTSPNYNGIFSDIQKIAEITKKYHAYLIVDEAHGAHLPFLAPDKSALTNGADLVVQSLHKTLPALTQTALLHVKNPELVDAVSEKLAFFMSSSPSYLLLASMDYAISFMRENSFEEYKKLLRDFREKVCNLKRIHILDVPGAMDETRIVLWADGLNGTALEKHLFEAGQIVCEMSGLDYVVLISTINDTKEAFAELYQTLQRIDCELLDAGKENCSEDAEDLQELSELLSGMLGKAAEQNIFVYPPGSYVICKGETVTTKQVERIMDLAKSGKKIRGIT